MDYNQDRKSRLDALILPVHSVNSGPQPQPPHCTTTANQHRLPLSPTPSSSPATTATTMATTLTPAVTVTMTMEREAVSPPPPKQSSFPKLAWCTSSAATSLLTRRVAPTTHPLPTRRPSSPTPSSSRSPSRAATPRRPRRWYVPFLCADISQRPGAQPSPPSPSSSSPSSSSSKSSPTSASPPASASSSASPSPALQPDNATSPPPPPPHIITAVGPVTLLTGSVLEAKWNNEKKARQSTSASASASASSPHLLTDSALESKWQNGDDQASDSPSPPPVNASSSAVSTNPILINDLSASDPYQAFAKFTRIAAPTASLGGQAPPSPSSAAATAASTVPPPPHGTQNSYSDSTSTIARRLLNYSLARRNLNDFSRLFCGDFDNYDQIALERSHDIFPGESGGHEHIHCRLTPVAPDTLFARYYFNGDPSHVFRSRVYRVRAHDACPGALVEMRIFRLYHEAEARLREANYDVGVLSWGENDMYDWMRGCEVFWERYSPRDGDGHGDEAGKLLGICEGDRFVGYMEGGGCEVYSNEVGGHIRVMDDLLLTRENLWVADRGFDERNQFVYGNRRGIPYKMQRVHEGGYNAWTLSASTPPPNGYVA